jgi:hypothetical protein
VATQSPFSFEGGGRSMTVFAEDSAELVRFRKSNVFKCGPNIHYHNSNAHLPKYPHNIVQRNIPKGVFVPTPSPNP